VTPAERVAVLAALLTLLVLSLRRPLFRWADARRARRVACTHDHDEDEENHG